MILALIRGCNQCVFIDRCYRRAENGIRAIVLNKVYKFSVLNPSRFGEGKLINLICGDCNSFSQALWHVYESVVSAFNIIFYIIGIWMMAGKVAFIVFILSSITAYIIKRMNTWIFSKWKEEETFHNEKSDILKNIFNNIKFIKIEGLENFFCAKVLKIQGKIAKIKFVQALFWLLLIFIWTTMYVLIKCCSFLYILYFQSDLGYANITVISSLFDRMNGTLGFLPWLLQGFNECRIRVNRINSFLNAKEIDLSYIKYIEDIKEAKKNKNLEESKFDEETAILSDSTEEDDSTDNIDNYSIILKNGEFTWNRKLEDESIKEEDI
jgi:ABC-type multidrug transport system fused ATPase/permease subunit